MPDTKQQEIKNKDNVRDFAPKNQAGGIFGYFVHHRTAANILLVVMLVVGFYSANNIRIQFFPDTVTDSVNIRYKWLGAGPKDIDNSVTQVVEPLLLDINGIESIESIAREGILDIGILFEDGIDSRIAFEDIKDKLNTLTSLPENVEDAEITKSRWTDRVTDIVLYGDISAKVLEEYAENLRQKFQQNNISDVDIRSAVKPVLRIEIRQDKLLEYRLNLNDIEQIVKKQLASSPSGDINNGNLRVRTGESRQNVESLKEITVITDDNGKKILLGDIANIVLDRKNKNVEFFTGDNNAISMRVNRDSSGDTIDIHEQAVKVVEKFKQTLPSSINIHFMNVRAQPIIDRIDILLTNGAFGLLLVVLLLFLFLSSRTAFWVAAGIPTAIGASIALLYIFGFSLNMISLFALIICLGIVVDDAIIVGEHSDFLHRQGVSAHQSAIWGTRRMLAPVFSASVTTIIAFLSLLLISGRFSKFIADLPITVAIVITASLIECFLILPAHMRHALSHQSYDKISWYDKPSYYINKGLQFLINHYFVPALSVILKIKWLIIALMLMILLISIASVIDKTVKWRFFSPPERSIIRANIAMIEGATRIDTHRMLSQIHDAVQKTNRQFQKEYDIDTVLFTLQSLGSYMGRVRGVSPLKDNNLRGGFAIELIDADLRPFTAFDFIKAWKENIPYNPLLEKLHVRGERSGPGGDNLEVFLYGDNLEILKQASEDIQRNLIAYSDISGLDDTLSYDKDELSLSLNPLGKSLGINEETIAAEIRARLRSITLTEFTQDNKTITMELGIPESDRGADFIENAYYVNNRQDFVSIDDITDSSIAGGFASIFRKDSLINVTVSGDIDSDNEIAFANIANDLENNILPDIKSRYNIDYALGGDWEQQKRFIDDAVIGLSLCLLGIYGVLSWIFSSFTQPILILLLVPFGAIGVVWGHYIHNIPMSMFSVIGFIGMAGIIINDAIVLLSTINEYRKTKAMRYAIIEAVSHRVRPVFLTTATTVIGLIPLMFEQSRQAQFLLPTVVTLAYGLAIGMFLVLLLIPSLLLIAHEMRQYFSSMVRFTKYIIKRKITKSIYLKMK